MTPEHYHTLDPRHRPMVFGTAMAILHDQHESQDITQDVFAKAYQQEDSDVQCWEAWLRTCSKNKSLGRLKYLKLRGLAAGEARSEALGVAVEPSQEDITACRAELKAILDYFSDGSVPNLLTISELTAIRLVAEGYDTEEIAEATGCTPDTVRTLICSARKKLRAHFRPE
jgi:RNA polymerase sigma factor (sigma-70 family)